MSKFLAVTATLISLTAIRLSDRVRFVLLPFRKLRPASFPHFLHDFLRNMRPEERALRWKNSHLHLNLDGHLVLRN